MERQEEEMRKEEDRRRKEAKRRLYEENRKKARDMDRKGKGWDTSLQELRNGDVVLVRRGVGVVKWVGVPSFAPADEYWVGVELKEAKGNCNGSIRGKRYFNCRRGHGVFVQDIQRRLGPEELLDKLNDVRVKLKKMKAKEDEITRARFNAECLRTKVATMTHQIRALKEDQAEG